MYTKFASYRARTNQLKQITVETLVQTEDKNVFVDDRGFRNWNNFACHSCH
jgi:hypothetical protein